MAINRDGTGNTNLHVTGFELDDKNSVPTRIQVMDKDGYLRWLACTDVDEAGIPVLHIEYPGVYGFQGGRIEASYTGVMEVEPLEITDPNQVIDVPSDVKYDPITVNIPMDMQELSLTTIPSNGTISPDEGYLGFDEVTVNIPYFTSAMSNYYIYTDPYASDSLYYTRHYAMDSDHNCVKIMANPIIALTGMAPAMAVTGYRTGQMAAWQKNGQAFYRKCGTSYVIFGLNDTQRSDMSTFLHDEPYWWPPSGGAPRTDTDALDYITYGMEVAKNQPYGLSAMIDPGTVAGRLSDIFNIPHKRLYNLTQSLYLKNVTWAIQDIFITGAGVNWTKETIIHLAIYLDSQYSQEDTMYTGFIRGFPHLMILDIDKTVKNIQYQAIRDNGNGGNPNLQVISFLHLEEEDLPTIASGGIPSSQNIKSVYFYPQVIAAARTKYAGLAWADRIKEMPHNWHRKIEGYKIPDIGGYINLDFEYLGTKTLPVT